MATGKNKLPQCTKAYLEPTTEQAQLFKQSKALGNKAQCYVALSRTLEEANELLKRAGASRITRNCILIQYAECVNTPSMDTEHFTFWTNEPASEQIIHSNDVDYPTQDIIEVLNGLSKED